MAKKLFITLTVSVAILAIGLVLNTNNTECIHSHEGHSCEFHLAQAESTIDQCPTCFNFYDDYGFCPLCDYDACPNCCYWTMNKLTMYCYHCGYSLMCFKCGKLTEFCQCDKE